VKAFIQTMKISFRHEPIPDPTHRVSNMAIGEVGYTVPWIVKRDEHGNVSIEDEGHVYRNPGGTAQLAIKRTDEGIEILSRDSFWTGNSLYMEY
jgi:hypothetical protein